LAPERDPKCHLLIGNQARIGVQAHIFRCGTTNLTVVLIATSRAGQLIRASREVLGRRKDVTSFPMELRVKSLQPPPWKAFHRLT
jgi:hypothetical protein